MENTFWDIEINSNFVELFKKSFTLYVESGMREMMERDIEVLRNEQGDFLAGPAMVKDFNKFIVDNFLCKFHCSICIWDI